MHIEGCRYLRLRDGLLDLRRDRLRDLKERRRDGLRETRRLPWSRLREREGERLQGPQDFICVYDGPLDHST